MSRKSYWPYNADVEGYFGRLKNVHIYPQGWTSTTIEQFVEALHFYVRWYNEKRIKLSLVFAVPSSTQRA